MKRRNAMNTSCDQVAKTTILLRESTTQEQPHHKRMKRRGAICHHDPVHDLEVKIPSSPLQTEKEKSNSSKSANRRKSSDSLSHVIRKLSFSTLHKVNVNS